MCLKQIKEEFDGPSSSLSGNGPEPYLDLHTSTARVCTMPHLIAYVIREVMVSWCCQ